jgi:hypothetical protein
MKKLSKKITRPVGARVHLPGDQDMGMEAEGYGGQWTHYMHREGGVMAPSETMQVTGGTLDEDVSFSFERRFLKGAKQCFLVESHMDAMSWVASTSDSVRPSGMVSNRKEGRRVGTSGFEKAFVVELSVNKSDMKASVVEDFGHLEHGVYVALSWERDTNCMGLLYYGRGTHIFVSH